MITQQNSFPAISTPACIVFHHPGMFLPRDDAVVIGVIQNDNVVTAQKREYYDPSGMTSKKICKINDIVQKGGGCQKKSNFECL